MGYRLCMDMGYTIFESSNILIVCLCVWLGVLEDANSYP